MCPNLVQTELDAMTPSQSSIQLSVHLPPVSTSTIYKPTSANLVLPTDNVRGELVAVLAAVAADVALEGLAEAVAAHVDGEHDMVQEENATVLAAEGAHWPPFPVHHLHGFPRWWRARAHLGR